MIARVLQRQSGGAASVAYPTTGAIAEAVPQPVQASDRGCQVILRLATPGSPTGYTPCARPIRRCRDTLALGGSLPTCTEVGVRLLKVKHGYDRAVRQADGTTSRYTLDPPHRTVAQQ